MEPTMYELHVESEFAAAHFLRGYAGRCERLHGHNWRVQAVLQARKLDKLGMALDFKEARALLMKVVDAFDHRNLNELPAFKKQNPTTENVSRVIYNELSKLLPRGVSVKSITTWESERCGATYSKGN